MNDNALDGIVELLFGRLGETNMPTLAGKALQQAANEAHTRVRVLTPGKVIIGLTFLTVYSINLPTSRTWY